jgi:hypothetical protein
MNDKFCLKQQEETPIQSRRHKRHTIRYAYARSSDTKANDDTGQDFLAIGSNESTLVFALCDGVSQSFFGDIAARFLGHALLDWLGEVPENHEDQEKLAGELDRYLHSLTEDATKLVQTTRLPADLPPMLRDVLEKKRNIGSESTFVCGRIDLSRSGQPGYLFLSWMGDSRLRLWSENDELDMLDPDTFLTRERWSTRHGPINGAPHVFCQSLEYASPSITRLSTYSDGFSLLDEYARALPTKNIQDLIDYSWGLPGSDDISFLEVWLDRYPSKLDHLDLPAPSNIHFQNSSKSLKITWDDVENATGYVIEIGRGKRTWQKNITAPHIALKPLHEEFRVRLRASQNDVSGLWSEWQAAPAVVQTVQPGTTVPIPPPVRPGSVPPPPPPLPPPSRGPARPASLPPPLPSRRRAYFYTGGIAVLLGIMLCMGMFVLQNDIRPEFPFLPTSTQYSPYMPIYFYTPPPRTSTSTLTPSPTLTLTFTPSPTIIFTPSVTPTPVIRPTLSIAVAPPPLPSSTPSKTAIFFRRPDVVTRQLLSHFYQCLVSHLRDAYAYYMNDILHILRQKFSEQGGDCEWKQ